MLWQVVGEHAQMEEAWPRLSQAIQERLRISRTGCWRLDREHASWIAVDGASPPTSIPIAHDELTVLDRWHTGSRWVPVNEIPKRLHSLLKGIRAHEYQWLVILGPKHHLTAIVGIERPGKTLIRESDRKWLDNFVAVMSAACSNDRRLRELEHLRLSVDADRQSLLRRLGRTELDDQVIGESTGLSQVMERVTAVCATDAPVLILGETGTGKELVARAIHQRGNRRDQPFIRVNCGAIPPELIDSQLFGHERGSFTGADKIQLGWFERASGGTLFLDEIGELPWEAQVRFLRVLQDGVVERVGAQRGIQVDVRIVAATHQDLASMVRAKRFREDLWYRLAVFPILLPPLRERVQDIPALAIHFAHKAAKRFGLPVVEPTAEEIQLLIDYDWPGNIRELGAVLDRAALLGNGQRLEIATALGFTTHHQYDQPGEVTADVVSREPRGPAQMLTLDQAMRLHIELALQRTKGRIEGPNGAATLLNINPHTLRARMRKLKISWNSFRS